MGRIVGLGRPDVTLCGWQDIEIQLLINLLVSVIDDGPFSSAFSR